MAARVHLGEIYLARVEVMPAESVLKPGQAVSLRVRAHWSTGAVEDVTAASVFKSSGDDIASVAAGGRVTTKGPGYATVTARYFGRSGAAVVIVPHKQGDGPAPALVTYERRPLASVSGVPSRRVTGSRPSG